MGHIEASKPNSLVGWNRISHPFLVTQCTNVRPTVIVGLFLQQVIALFVLKTGAGFSIFSWIAQLAADFLGQAHAGAVFFFDENATQWFFVGVVRL